MTDAYFAFYDLATYLIPSIVLLVIFMAWVVGIAIRWMKHIV